MNKIYLDNAATTPIPKEVKDYIIDQLDNYGNPGSVYSIGRDTKDIIVNTRHEVAEFIQANDDEVFFTSGGSASNNLSIRGFMNINPESNIYYMKTCHKSIVKLIEKDSNYRNCYMIPIDYKGSVRANDFETLIEKHGAGLVVLEYANSEIGTVQNIQELTKIAHKHGCTVYVDCTGSIASIPLYAHDLDIDMAGFSAHKIGGLKGCGVFYKKNGIEVASLISGSQEGGLFGGTENYIGICSLRMAIMIHRYSYVSSQIRDALWNFIASDITDCIVVGDMDNRLPHNLYVCFKGISGEQLVTLLDIYNVYVSTGSACNNYSKEHSSVLSALGIGEEWIDGGVRITLSGEETAEEMLYFEKTLKQQVEALRRANQ